MRILILTLATVITNKLNLFDADFNINIGNSNLNRTRILSLRILIFTLATVIANGLNILMQILILTLATVIRNGLNLFDADFNIYIGNSN